MDFVVIPSPPPRGNYYNAHARNPQENGRPNVWLSTVGVVDLCSGAVSERTSYVCGSTPEVHI